jgi:hypothetical protein
LQGRFLDVSPALRNAFLRTSSGESSNGSIVNERRRKEVAPLLRQPPFVRFK